MTGKEFEPIWKDACQTCGDTRAEHKATVKLYYDELKRFPASVVREAFKRSLAQEIAYNNQIPHITKIMPYIRAVQARKKGAKRKGGKANSVETLIEQYGDLPRAIRLHSTFRDALIMKKLPQRKEIYNVKQVFWWYLRRKGLETLYPVHEYWHLSRDQFVETFCNESQFPEWREAFEEIFEQLTLPEEVCPRIMKSATTNLECGD